MLLCKCVNSDLIHCAHQWVITLLLWCYSSLHYHQRNQGNVLMKLGFPTQVYSLLKWTNGNAVCQGYCTQWLSMILAIVFCFVNELQRSRVRMHSLWVQLFGLMRWHSTFKRSGWYLWYTWFMKNILFEKKNIELQNEILCTTKQSSCGIL